MILPTQLVTIADPAIVAKSIDKNWKIAFIVIFFITLFVLMD